MTPSCTFAYQKELLELHHKVVEALFYDDGSVISSKDFGPLCGAVNDLKNKLDDIMDDCAGDMCGKRVITSLGTGKVVSFGMSGHNNREHGTLVYKVILDEGSEQFFYDNEMEILYENS